MRTHLTLAFLVALAACSPPQTVLVDPPQDLELTVTSGQAVMTWRHGVNAQRTLVLRTLGTVDATRPDGSLAVGDALGGGVVVYAGDGTRFVDSSFPDSCGPFAWHLWGLSADGVVSATATTGRSLRGAHTLAPQVEVTGLGAVFDGPAVRLSWTNPEANTGFKQVTVLRKQGSAPANPNDGATVYSGPSATAVDQVTNLSSSAPTHYAVFNCNECGKCAPAPPSVAVTRPAGDAGVGDGGVDISLTGLMAAVSVDRQTVQLSWTSAAPTVRVLRTLNSGATGLMDPSATVVFDGPGAGAAERMDLLLPNLPLEPRTYTYTAWGCAGAVCSATPSTTTFALTLVQALQGGGYTLHWRHASASTCADNTSLGPAATTNSPNWWKSCDDVCTTATARQLTPPNSDSELTAVHDFFTARGLSVGRVLTSEFCRCVRTAQGFAFGPTLEERPELTYFVYDETNRCANTYALLNVAPAQGTNTALVGHAGYPAACAVLDGLQWGEAAIFKPVSGGQPRAIGRVTASGWVGLP